MKRCCKLFERVLQCLMVLSLLYVPMASGNDLQDLLRQKEETNQQQNELQGRLNWGVETTNVLVLELDKLEGQIYHSQVELSNVQAQLAVLNEKIIDISERIAETASHQQQIDELAQERLRVLYKNSTMSYLEVLFEATSYSDFIQRFDLVRTLLESDMELLGKLQHLKNSQENDRRALEDELTVQRRIEEQQVLNTMELTRQQSEKNYLVENIQLQMEDWRAAKAEMDRVSEAIGAEIRDWQEKNRGKALGSGTYAWPLTMNYTYITSEFGMRDDPFGGTTVNNHGGMDIAADPGAEIMAVDNGIVIMAEYGYNGGYGNMVMIDHGNGIATLYGHCTTLLVRADQSVSKGETIATVGSTGWSTGPHLHIEFRIDGVRTEPRDYLFD